MNQNTPHPATLSVDETARLLGVSTDAVRDAVTRGEIASLRVGRRVLVTAAPMYRALGIEVAEDMSVDQTESRRTRLLNH
jgi:excisionase family DNA binding protein